MSVPLALPKLEVQRGGMNFLVAAADLIKVKVATKKIFQQSIVLYNCRAPCVM
jgi:hypothetical protein